MMLQDSGALIDLADGALSRIVSREGCEWTDRAREARRLWRTVYGISGRHTDFDAANAALAKLERMVM